MRTFQAHRCIEDPECLVEGVAELRTTQHTGMLISRYRTDYDALLCRRHGSELFCKATGWTLVFGWWGLISLFVTPAVLLANVVEYSGFRGRLRAAGRERSSARPLPAPGLRPAAPSVAPIHWRPLDSPDRPAVVDEVPSTESPRERHSEIGAAIVEAAERHPKPTRRRTTFDAIGVGVLFLVVVAFFGLVFALRFS